MYVVLLYCNINNINCICDRIFVNQILRLNKDWNWYNPFYLKCLLNMGILIKISHNKHHFCFILIKCSHLNTKCIFKCIEILHITLWQIFIHNLSWTTWKRTHGSLGMINSKPIYIPNHEKKRKQSKNENKHFLCTCPKVLHTSTEKSLKLKRDRKHNNIFGYQIAIALSF